MFKCGDVYKVCQFANDIDTIIIILNIKNNTVSALLINVRSDNQSCVYARQTINLNKFVQQINNNIFMYKTTMNMYSLAKVLLCEQRR